jgi:type II secretory pathway pseudopilin PulG
MARSSRWFGHSPATRWDRGYRGSFTLVEMLVAMAITLVMMAAVVTLFANVSNSVRNRRATIEMSGQLRHLRNVLQQDLRGATCPGVTWQRPDSNHGYIELIEGQYREGYASMLVDGVDNLAPPDFNGEIDYKQSVLPASNLPFASPDWVTDGGGLGDYDDIFMLTVRNEREPFVGKSPVDADDDRDSSSDGDPAGYEGWNAEAIESPLAEVIWYAIENPAAADNANNFFGEPGMRTIYRRALLIAPWVNPYLEADTDGDGIVQLTGGLTIKPVPGLCRVLPSNRVGPNDVAAALAALTEFQDRYDLSVRLEWDYNIGHWKIVANTLADLTKRENRYLHYGFWKGQGSNDPDRRIFPYGMVSVGSGYSGSSQDVEFIQDDEIPRPGGSGQDARATGHMINMPGLNGLAVYTVETDNYTSPVGDSRRYGARPFAFVDATPTNGVPATARAMLDDAGHVVRVVHGPAPLWGTRRGEDVMMTDAVAFDVRVYDPGAPLFGARDDLNNTSSPIGVILDPSDPGWAAAYVHQDNTDSVGSFIGESVANNTASPFPFVSQGAYVDMGYGFSWRLSPPAMLPIPKFAVSSYTYPWFFVPRTLSDVSGNQLAPGYAVYDTWSFHYENNGVNEDADSNAAGLPLIDEGTDGLDGMGNYVQGASIVPDTRLGVDDVGERETTPPYDKPLRGAQVLVRVYERDSRAVRQVRVNQHFMPE